MYDLPHQVRSNPVSCVKPSCTGRERKVYTNRASAVTLPPASTAQ